MKTKRTICPACGHRAYYMEEGDRDCEGQQLEPDYSCCNYCYFRWEEYQAIWDEDKAYVYRKGLPLKKINWRNLFYTLSLEREEKRRVYKYKCSWCGKYLNEDKCPKCSSGYLLKLH